MLGLSFAFCTDPSGTLGKIPGKIPGDHTAAIASDGTDGINWAARCIALCCTNEYVLTENNSNLDIAAGHRGDTGRKDRFPWRSA